MEKNQKSDVNMIWNIVFVNKYIYIQKYFTLLFIFKKQWHLYKAGLSSILVILREFRATDSEMTSTFIHIIEKKSKKLTKHHLTNQ